MPQISVDEIKKILSEGQSVFIRDSKGNLRHVTDPSRLPTEADLARGDEMAANQAVASSKNAGVDPDQLASLEAKVNELIAQAKERESDATRALKAEIAALQAKLAEPKPAPAHTPTPAPAPAPSPKPEVKK